MVQSNNKSWVSTLNSLLIGRNAQAGSCAASDQFGSFDLNK